MTFPNIHFGAIALAFGLIAGPSLAAEMSPVSRAGADPIAGDGVYKAFHERAGIDRFKGANLDHLSVELKAQVCYLVGGPCTYNGKDMRSAHESMGLRNLDFNALAEDLQLSMNKEGVPFSAQNRLLAKLAPMQRAIVTK
jgi:hemoglobin